MILTETEKQLQQIKDQEQLIRESIELAKTNISLATAFLRQAEMRLDGLKWLSEVKNEN